MTDFIVVCQQPGLYIPYHFRFYCCLPTAGSLHPVSISDFRCQPHRWDVAHHPPKNLSFFLQLNYTITKLKVKHFNIISHSNSIPRKRRNTIKYYAKFLDFVPIISFNVLPFTDIFLKKTLPTAESVLRHFLSA